MAFVTNAVIVDLFVLKNFVEMLIMAELETGLERGPVVE